ncbi:hypothetical protein CN563_13885 [Bacillus sp. AFS026049]|nr:hypothetical protein CN563_13885 [Bacillus sp. AFS026049]
MYSIQQTSPLFIHIFLIYFNKNSAIIVSLEQSLIKLIQGTLINEKIERACFEKRLIKNMPLYGLFFYKKD